MLEHDLDIQLQQALATLLHREYWTEGKQTCFRDIHMYDPFVRQVVRPESAGGSTLRPGSAPASRKALDTASRQVAHWVDESDRLAAIDQHEHELSGVEAVRCPTYSTMCRRYHPSRQLRVPLGTVGALL